MTNIRTRTPTAVDELDRGRASRILIAAVRIAVGLLWIQNVTWKRPPDFGRAEGNGLFEFTNDAILHPVFAPFTWAVQNIVMPNFVAFGYVTLLVEFCLGAFLLAGLLTRFWALVGIAQTVAITLSVLNTPNEWQWSYYLMLAAHLVLLATAAGRTVGLDGLLRSRWAESSSPAARLAMRLS